MDEITLSNLAAAGGATITLIAMLEEIERELPGCIDEDTFAVLGDLNRHLSAVVRMHGSD